MSDSLDGQAAKSDDTVRFVPTFTERDEPVNVIGHSSGTLAETDTVRGRRLSGGHVWNRPRLRRRIVGATRRSGR